MVKETALPAAAQGGEGRGTGTLAVTVVLTGAGGGHLTDRSQILFVSKQKGIEKPT